jgi:hypothetical protein
VWNVACLDISSAVLIRSSGVAPRCSLAVVLGEDFAQPAFGTDSDSAAKIGVLRMGRAFIVFEAQRFRGQTLGSD